MGGLIQYRLTIVEPTAGTPFVPGQTTDPTDHFYVTSRRRVSNPWIEAPPDGEGQQLDLTLGKAQDGQYNVRVIDIPEPTCTDYTSLILAETLGADYLGAGGWAVDGFQQCGANGTILDWWQPASPLFGGSALAFWVDNPTPPYTCGSWVRSAYIWKTYTGLTPNGSYGVRVVGSWSLDTGAGNIFVQVQQNKVSFPNGSYSFYTIDQSLSPNVVGGTMTAQADGAGNLTIALGGENYAPSCNVTCGFSEIEIYECTPPAPGTGSGPRYVTRWLADANARQQLLGRAAYVEQSVDDAASWQMLQGGFVTSLEMDASLVYTIAIGDTRRVERTTRAWGDVDPVNEPDLSHMTALLGGPVYGGFPPYSPTFELPLFRVVSTLAPTGARANTEPSDGWTRLNYISGPMPPGFRHPGTSHASALAYRTINERAQPFFDSEPTWDVALPSGSFPGLRAALFDGANGALVLDNATPLGINFARIVFGSSTSPAHRIPIAIERGQEFITTGLEIVIRPANTDPALTVGDYYYVLVTPREVSEQYPLYLRDHPVDLEVTLLQRHGIPVDTTGVAGAKALLGADLTAVLRYVNPDQTVADACDQLHAFFGYTTRINDDGERQFVVTRQFVDTTPSLNAITDDLRDEGGPTYELDEDSRRNRVIVSQQFFRTIDFDDEDVLGAPDAVRSLEGVRTFDYSADGGVTLDADVYGPQEVKLVLPGHVAWGYDAQAAGDYQASSPMNQVQWGQGVARHVFALAARGVQEATIVTLRDAADADAARIGDPFALDASHVPNAQIAQTPTSQRGGTRWWRVAQRTESPEGAVLQLADAGTGVAFPDVVTLTVEPDDYDPNYFITVLVQNSTDIWFASAWLEVECALGTAPPSGHGVRYTIIDGRQMVDAGNAVMEPYTARLGPFPYGAIVWVRARGFLLGGTPGAWSAWSGLGGSVIAPPANDLSNLLFTTPTADSITVSWTNTDTTNQVRVSYRLNDTGAYTVFSTIAIGSTTETITGLTPGAKYGIKVVLWTGAAETGTPLHGVIIMLPGYIAGLTFGTPGPSTATLYLAYSTHPTANVKVERRVNGTVQWTLAALMPPMSSQIVITGLAPATTYNYRVVLVTPLGVEFGNVLTGNDTTAAVSGVALAAPTSITAYAGFDPSTGIPVPGRFGARVVAETATNPPHTIVFELAVETGVGTGTPGAYVEILQTPAIMSGGYTDYIDTAPNDAKLRYMRARARQAGYPDSAYTAVVSVDPWGTVAPPNIGPHAPTHENGGSDEIDVTGLSGRLADPQDADSLNGNPVNAPTPADLEVLTWDNTAGEWISAAGASGITIRKNTGADVGTRPRVNLIEGTNITLTVADDGGSNEVDVTVATSAGSGGNPPSTPAGAPYVWFYADDPNITVDGSNQPTAIPNNGSLGGNFTLDATATKRGVMVATARNGLAALRLDGTDDYMKISFSAITDHRFQVIMACRRQAGIAGSPRMWALTTASGANSDFTNINHMVLFVQNGTADLTGLNLYRNSVYRVGSANAPAPFSWAPYVLEAHNDATHYRLTINGLQHESLVTDGTTTTAFSFVDFLIGVGYHTTSSLNSYNRVDVYEVLFYTGANILGETDLDLTRRYLAAKWAIPCSNLT